MFHLSYSCLTPFDILNYHPLISTETVNYHLIHSHTLLVPTSTAKLAKFLFPRSLVMIEMESRVITELGFCFVLFSEQYISMERNKLSLVLRL